jgi:outer membrane protein assembly factor BamE (lipoprotein component of BamABCDE complex)
MTVMGSPAARIKRSDGDEILYFPRYPDGRVCYAVTIGSDSVMKGIEQRLNRANFAKILVGKSTRDQVRELIGPPSHILHQQFKGSDVWEYPWYEIDEKRSLFVEFSADGLVLRVDEVHDQFSDKPSLS